MEGDSADYTKIHFPFSSVTTGSPSSSCEIIILQNKSHSEFLRVCMAYLRPLLGIKNFIKTLNENTSLFFTQYIARNRPLTMLKEEPILASYPFLRLLRTYETGLSYVRGKPRNG